jgi:ketosteroid isomerase-like protein
MKYLVLAYGAEENWNALPESERNALLAQDEVLRKRGDVVAAVQDAVTTVRAWDGTPTTTDAAFASSNAPLAGFGIIAAANLDEAIRLVAQTPCARAKGAVELRPIAAIDDDAEEAGNEEAEILTLIEARTNAVRAKDVTGATAHVAPNVVSFDVVNPLRYDGVEEVRKRAADWFSSFDGELGFDVSDLNIVVGNGVAFSHSLNRVNATRTDGSKLSMCWRATVCYRKIYGSWMVTHEHNSVPFDPQTGKASLNLEP